jgi:hypothetical protein
MTLNGLKNLRPFEKGHKRTPNAGRPKGSKSLTTILREIINEPIERIDKKTGLKDVKPTSEWLMSVMVRDALKGDLRAIREILDRLEGRPTQKINQITTIDFKSMDLSSLSDEQLQKLLEDNTIDEPVIE